MTNKLRAGILGMGRYVPEKVIKNHDLEKIVDTSMNGFVRERELRKDALPMINRYFIYGVEAKKHLKMPGLAEKILILFLWQQ